VARLPPGEVYAPEATFVRVEQERLVRHPTRCREFAHAAAPSIRGCPNPNSPSILDVYLATFS